MCHFRLYDAKIIQQFSYKYVNYSWCIDAHRSLDIVQSDQRFMAGLFLIFQLIDKSKMNLTQRYLHSHFASITTGLFGYDINQAGSIESFLCLYIRKHADST